MVADDVGHGPSELRVTSPQGERDRPFPDSGHTSDGRPMQSQSDDEAQSATPADHALAMLAISLLSAIG